MEIFVLFTYLLFGVLLFNILNALNKKFSITITDYIVISLIYIVIISTFYSYTNNIFLIIIFEFLTNIIHTTYIKEENFFKYRNRIYMYIITIVLAFILNERFINTNSIVLTKSELRIVIWILIGVFVYLFFNKYNIKYTSEKLTDNKSNIDNKQYIVMMFAKMKNNYNDVFNCDKNLSYILYAGMIYLNHERPYYLRKVDNYKMRFDNKKRKLGIMQIESDKVISDEESISLAIKELEKISNRVKKQKIKKNEVNNKIISTYYKPYEIDKITNIYNTILEFNKD